MSDQELDAIWEALSREEKLKVLEAHLNEMVARGELWVAEEDGVKKYFAPRSRMLDHPVS